MAAEAKAIIDLNLAVAKLTEVNLQLVDEGRE